MKRTYKTTLLTILTLSMMSGCDSKTENNIQASIEAGKAMQETKNIKITHNTNIETKEENYKTVTYYSENEKERADKIKECNKSYSSNHKKNIECNNAKRARQIKKRQYAEEYIRNH